MTPAVLVLLFVLAQASDPPTFDDSDWGWRFPIDTTHAPQGFVRVLLTPAVLDVSQPSLADIRVADEADRPVPHLIYREKQAAAELAPTPVAACVPTYDDETQRTILDVDLGYRNLPVVSVSLAVADPHFYRAFDLFGRNESDAGQGRVEQDPNAPWQPLLHGVLFRVRGADGSMSEQVAFENLSAPYRYLQFRINDADNPPLTFNGAKALRTQDALVFEARQGKAYTLITGNPKAAAPQFDLTRAVQNLNVRNCPAAPLGAPAPIQHGRKLAPWVVGALLLLAASVMVFLIVQNLGKVRQL